MSAALVATAMCVAGSLSAQTLFTPSGTVSNGSGGVGVGANPAFAPLDVVGSNILLRPSNSFNPSGKFIGIGESGGVVGPINGCDLYGFRAQRNINQSFINMGIRRISIPGGPQAFIDDLPTISWGGDVSFFPGGTPFRKSLDFLYDNSGTSCGTTVARMSSPSLTYQLTVFGSALASGGVFVNSDARYKQNIQPISNAMGLLTQIQGTTYTMNLEAFPERNFSEGTQYGFIAQDLQQVVPEVVQEDEDGYLAVNYSAVLPLMVEGIKEQQTVIETQQAQLEEQQTVLQQQDALIRQLQEDVRALQTAMQVERKDAPGTSTSTSQEEGAQLFQNRPNPFMESTEIFFYLPNDVAQASLVIYSLEGKEMLTFNGLDRGYGNVLVEAGQLEAGNYVYRLIADGEVIDSKKMLLSK